MPALDTSDGSPRPAQTSDDATPTGAVGPTGPTGAVGPTGPTRPTGAVDEPSARTAADTDAADPSAGPAASADPGERTGAAALVGAPPGGPAAVAATSGDRTATGDHANSGRPQMTDGEGEPHPAEELGPPRRPEWQGSVPRMGVILLVIAAAWLAVTAVRSLQGIVGPLLLVLNLVIVAYPVQARLNRLGLPRVIGAIVSGLIVFAIVMTFFGALAWSMALLVQEIPAYQQQFSALYQQALDLLARVGVSETQAMSQLQAELNPTRVVGLAASTLSGLTGALTLLLVTVTIVFVVLIDSMSLPLRLEVAGRNHADIVAALTGFAQGVRRYWVVSSVFGAMVAVLDVAALWYLNVPLAIVWGMLSFLTNYIPNIGFVIGIIPPTLMALLANDPQTALMVVIAYCVINFVIQSIIQPKFLGDAVGVTATISLLSLLFWAWVLGPLGALLALPSTLLCKALLVDLDPRMRWVDAFIASHPERGNQLRQGRRGRSTDESVTSGDRASASPTPSTPG